MKVFLLMFFFFFLFYILGRTFLLCFFKEIEIKGISFPTTLGLGMFILLLFISGILHILYTPVIFIEIIAFFLIFHSRFIEALKRFKEDISFFKKNLIFLLFLLPFFILPLYPAKEFDSTLYHLPQALEYKKHHALVFNPEIRNTYFPSLNKFLISFVIGDELGSEVRAHGMTFLMFLLLLSGMIEFSIEVGINHLRWLAPAIVAGSPLFLYLSGTTYMETGVSLFVFFTVFSLIRFYYERNSKWPFLFIIFGLCSIGFKLTGFLFIGIAAWFFIFLISYEKGKMGGIIFLGTITLLTSFWIIGNVITKRDPLYPLPLYSTINLSGRNPETKFTPLNLLIFPYFMAKNKSLIAASPLWWFKGMDFQPVLYILFFFPVSSLLTFYVVKKNFRFLGSFFFLMIWISIILWFLISPQERYIFPLLPLCSLLLSLFISHLQILKKKELFNILLSIIFILPSYLFLYRFLQREGLPPSQKEIHLFYKNHYPSYPAYYYLNKIASQEDALYNFFDERMSYFFKGRFLGDHFGVYAFDNIIARLFDGKEIYDYLKSVKANYFLISGRFARGRLLKHLNSIKTPEWNWVSDIVHHRNFLFLFANPNTYLFKILEQEREPYEFSENLLKNSEFEKRGNKIVEWGGNGITSPVIGNCYENKNCVFLKGSIFQSVVLPERSIYLISHCASSPSKEVLMRLQVNWHDVKGNFIGTSIRVVEISKEWECNELFVTSPPEAKIAKYYLTIQKGDSIFISSPSFRYIKNYEKILSDYNLPYPSFP